MLPILPSNPPPEQGFCVAYYHAQMPVRHFVKYTFLQVDPAWRRLEADQRANDKREFMAACEDFADGHLLRPFSLVGQRGDPHLLLLTQAGKLDPTPLF